jgi:flagellar biosynthesis protein FlhF
MKIRRFTARDTREALQQIREALGPDAVILETQRVEDGVEVSAAVDANDATDAAAATAGAPGVTRSSAAAPVPPRAPTPAVPLPADIGQLQDEVRLLRGLLETELARLTWDQKVRRDASTTSIVRNLARLGLARDVVQNIVNELRDSVTPATTWSAPLAKLVETIPTCDADLIAGGGVFAVVGPTGVGKTTSIAKLAARYALTGNPRDIALVTTDTYRIAAREQLETFGQIIGAPVYQATDGEHLHEILDALGVRRLVLIDTAGMGQRDVRLARQLSWFARADNRVQVLLALPGNGQTESLAEIVDAFLVARPVACILTKTDEANSLGGAFSVLIRTGLPLAYVANGQRVPEDLHFAKPRQAWLVKTAVELMNRRDDINDDFMAEHFAEVTIDACA